MIFKCKPVWLFQSVEFDVEVKDSEDLKKLFDIYEKVLKELIRIAPEQQKNPIINREPPATTRQKEIMKSYGIPFTSSTTMSEASKLIEASRQKAQE